MYVVDHLKDKGLIEQQGQLPADDGAVLYRLTNTSIMHLSPSLAPSRRLASRCAGSIRSPRRG